MTAADWTLITVPSGIQPHVADARNEDAQDVLIRTDETDPNTEDSIPAGFSRILQFSGRGQPRALFYAKPLAGVGPLIVVYTA